MDTREDSVRGRIDWKLGIDICTRLYLRWMTNKDGEYM